MGTWQGDAVGLVEAFRSGDHTPLAELEAVYAAIDASDLNAITFTDRELAHKRADNAELQLPFGGVPVGVKSLTAVDKWPDDHGSMPLRNQVADRTATMVERIADAGAVLAAQTSSSEFGAVNITRTVLHGTTHNPWERKRTPGGSSGGSAAAVAGGLLPIATGGDGGGSIRIPAGFCGLVGLKGTFGRIPLGPRQQLGNLTVSTGCLTRSVRDTARWFDVANGHHPTDPLSLPRVTGWEAGLGTHLNELRGRRVAIVADWGGATVSPIMWELLEATATDLANELGLVRVDVDTALPRMGAAWAISGMLSIAAQLTDLWPACAHDLTPEVRAGLEQTEGRYSAEARARIERRRMELNERMAEIFDHDNGVDFVITASNPDVAFDAEGPLPKVFGGVEAPKGRGNNGLLTFPANMHGNPAISIPAGAVDGLPIGLQVVGRHFDEPALLDIALTVERSKPWPLVAPTPR